MLKMFSFVAVMYSHPILVDPSPRNRPNGSVVCLAQVEGLGSQVNSDTAGPKARQFAVYERSQMVGPLALVFLLFR